LPLAWFASIARSAAAQAPPPAPVASDAPAASASAPTPAAAPAPATVAPVSPAPDLVPPNLIVPSVQLAVPWTENTGRSFSFGLEEGGWSGVWGTGLRVFIPFVERLGGERYSGSFGLALRGLLLTGSNESTSSDPAEHFGGRLELIGRSPVFLNLVRLYGGGGVEVFSAFGSGVNHEALVSGGGEFGFEFFLHHRFSFYLEVGGHGGVDGGLQGGETVIAGMNFYPFSS
jgi:hypothetical protein